MKEKVEEEKYGGKRKGTTGRTVDRERWKRHNGEEEHLFVRHALHLPPLHRRDADKPSLPSLTVDGVMVRWVIQAHHIV